MFHTAPPHPGSYHGVTNTAATEYSYTRCSSEQSPNLSDTHPSIHPGIRCTVHSRPVAWAWRKLFWLNLKIGPKGGGGRGDLATWDQFPSLPKNLEGQKVLMMQISAHKVILAAVGGIKKPFSQKSKMADMLFFGMCIIVKPGQFRWYNIHGVHLVCELS